MEHVDEDNFDVHHCPKPDVVEQYDGFKNSFFCRSDNGVEIWSTPDVSIFRVFKYIAICLL